MRHRTYLLLLVFVAACHGVGKSKDAGVVSDAAIDGGAGGPCGVSEPAEANGATAGMKLVPAGPFWRGCNQMFDTECGANELPGSCVTVSTFEIDATEVTESEFAACVADGGCSDSDPLECGPGAYEPTISPQVPVTCATWDDAVAYCEWAGKRLPTEAEWEKAARGTDGRIFPWGYAPPTCARANYAPCGGKVDAVAQDPEGNSIYGVADMSGNVSEWVNDWYDNDYTSAPLTDPQGPDGGSLKVVRGGSADDDDTSDIRASSRGVYSPSDLYGFVGFRCARSVSP